MANKDVSLMNAAELTAYIDELKALKRDKKAKKSKEARAAMFAPLFDAIDNAISASPQLTAYLNEQKDSLRITIADSVVNRENYRSYQARGGNGSTNGGRNGTTVWHRVTKGEHKGKMVEFASIRSLCDFYEIPNNGASGRIDAKKHKIEFLEVRPEGEITTFPA